jgi:hypothetical protein
VLQALAALTQQQRVDNSVATSQQQQPGRMDMYHHLILQQDYRDTI